MSSRAVKRIGPGGSHVNPSTSGRPSTESLRSSIAVESASGMARWRTSSRISWPKRFCTTDSGACPLRNPGSAASLA